MLGSAIAVETVATQYSVQVTILSSPVYERVLYNTRRRLRQAASLLRDEITGSYSGLSRDLLQGIGNQFHQYYCIDISGPLQLQIG
jgi:hypothetical protein